MSNEKITNYNQIPYFQEVSLIKMDDEMLTREIISKSFIVLNSAIMEIEFINDIETTVLYGHIVIKDVGFNYQEVLSNYDGRLICSVIIKRQINDYEFDREFEHLFLVKNIEVLNRELNTVTYRLHITSMDTIKFNNFTVYSTTTNTPKIIPEILKAIFKDTELELDIDIPNDNFKKIVYLTPTNFNLFDNIDALLTGLVSKESGVFSIIYDHFLSKYKLVSIYNQFSGNSEGNIENLFSVPTKDRVSDNFHAIANGLSQLSRLSLSEKLDYSKPFAIPTFDYTTRKMNIEQWSRNEVQKSIQPIDPLETESRIKPPLKYMKENSRELKVVNRSILADHLKFLFLHTNVAEFETFGNIKRKPADKILLDIDKNNELYQIFSGIWLATRVHHKFVLNIYKNTIQITKPDIRKG